MEKVPTEQIAQWKEAHGEILQYDLDGHIAFCKKPDRAAMNMAEKMLASSSLDANMALVTNCWLGGDPITKVEIKYINGLAEALMDEVRAVKAMLKKL